MEFVYVNLEFTTYIILFPLVLPAMHAPKRGHIPETYQFHQNVVKLLDS